MISGNPKVAASVNDPPELELKLQLDGPAWVVKQRFPMVCAPLTVKVAFGEMAASRAKPKYAVSSVPLAMPSAGSQFPALAQLPPLLLIQ